MINHCDYIKGMILYGNTGIQMEEHDISLEFWGRLMHQIIR